jgi:hypothetical protein
LCNYSFNKYFAVQAELNYLVEGLAYYILYDDSSGAFGLDYIEIPLIVQLKTPVIILKFNAFIETGISMKCRVLATHFIDDPIEEYKYNVSRHFNDVIIDGIIGIGLKIDITKNFIFLINSRLRYDFTPIGKQFYDEKTSMDWSFNNIRFTHLTIFSFGVIYKFK